MGVRKSMTDYIALEDAKVGQSSALMVGSAFASIILGQAFAAEAADHSNNHDDSKPFWPDHHDFHSDYGSC